MRSRITHRRKASSSSGGFHSASSAHCIRTAIEISRIISPCLTVQCLAIGVVVIGLVRLWRHPVELRGLISLVIRRSEQRQVWLFTAVVVELPRSLAVEGSHPIRRVSSGTRRPAGILLRMHIIESVAHLELQVGFIALEGAGWLSGREGLICKEPTEVRCGSLNACSKLHTKLVQLERTTEA